MNSDHKSSGEPAVIMPIPAGDVPPRDIVLCSGCGCLTTRNHWDVHLGTHQDLQEIIEVLRDVSKVLFGQAPTISGEALQKIQRWSTE